MPISKYRKEGVVMSCQNNQTITTGCQSSCCRPRNSFVIIIVLYILLAIILGSACTW